MHVLTAQRPIDGASTSSNTTRRVDLDELLRRVVALDLQVRAVCEQIQRLTASVRR